MNQEMLAAFHDELEKIANEPVLEKVPEKKGPSFPRWLRNTALIGGGVAVGTAAGMAAHKALSTLAGPRFSAMPAGQQRAILAPIIAGAGIATALAGDRMMKKRMEADEGE